MNKGIKNYLSPLEKRLDKFYDSMPELSVHNRRLVSKYLPYISLILGLLTLLDAYNLWHVAHNVNSLVSYANSNSALYDTTKVHFDHHMGLAFWLGLITLLIEAYYFIKAYKGAQQSVRSAWNLIYYALLLNGAYGVIMLFSFYGGSGLLIERLLFSLVCLYFLFSVKDSYRLSGRPKKS